MVEKWQMTRKGDDMTTKNVKQSSNPAQEGRELKEKLKMIRVKAVEFERVNNSKLIFFRYGKKFWAAGDITMLVVTNWEDMIRKMAKLASSDTSASPMSEDKRVIS